MEYNITNLKKNINQLTLLGTKIPRYQGFKDIKRQRVANFN